MSEANVEWKGTTGGGNVGQRSLIFLFRHFSVRIGYFFMAFAIPFYMLFARKGYRAIRDYFRDRYGYTGLINLGKVYRNHYLFGQMMLDRFPISAGRGKGFSIEITGAEYFNELINGEKGFVIASAHVGNFEIAGYMLRQDKKIQNAVVYGGESEFLQSNRGKALGENVNLIPVGNDMTHLFAIKAALDRGEIVSMPADRMLGSRKSAKCDFLGTPAHFPLGVFQLAAQTEVPVVAIFVMKERGQKYHIYIYPVEVDRAEYKTSKEIAQALACEYSGKLEEIVGRYPEQWFNFYDFWKKTD